MSTLSDILDDLRSLLFAPLCAACGATLLEGERFVCLKCRLEMPQTDYWKHEENQMLERLQLISPLVHHASAYFYYNEGSPWRSFMHHVKYGGGWRNGEKLGFWFGAELAASPHYQEIDAVVALPLHPIKRMRRGYNQSEHIAHGVAKALSVKQLRGVVRRQRNNASQTLMSRHERWENTRSLFKVIDAQRLAGRNILLIDDVLTTGATLAACIEAIEKAAPACRLYVVTLAISASQFGSHK